jgi:four helix bundle protein
MMNAESKTSDLRIRTKQFALRVIRLYGSLPNSTVAQTLGKQVLKSGTSVDAQYREGCRARSDAEMISKFESALQELDETAYWFELLIEGEVVAAQLMTGLVKEANELIAMLTASVKTIKGRANA